MMQVESVRESSASNMAAPPTHSGTPTGKLIPCFPTTAVISPLDGIMILLSPLLLTLTLPLVSFTV